MPASLFFADDYIRHTEGTPPASQTPNMESAFQAVHNALPKLENRVIEFLAEWPVALLAPARHVLETRSPHLSFMLLKDYWFRELYLSLKVTASFDRTESYVRVIDEEHPNPCIALGSLIKRGADHQRPAFFPSGGRMRMLILNGFRNFKQKAS